MKIAYLFYGDVSKENGVLKKVVAQTQGWAGQGLTVKLFAPAGRNGVWTGLKDIPLRMLSAGGVGERFSTIGVGIDTVLNWQPDLVYTRFEAFFPPLRKLAQTIPVILEINTDDMAEYRTNRPFFKYWYYRLTRGFLLKKAAGFVFVTHELAQNSSFTKYGKPGKVIGNGIALADYPQIPAPDNPSPRLVFMGSAGHHPWHGTEKIVELAEHFPEWTVDVIGLSGPDTDLPAPANINWHGFLRQSAYYSILAETDVAIGTLALHKNLMDEACPLKVREYLAYGIPVITGYRDTDFPDGHPLMLALPNTPDNITTHIKEIAGFIQAVKGQRVSRHSIKHLDTSSKEAERVDFFRHILSAL